MNLNDLKTGKLQCPKCSASDSLRIDVTAKLRLSRMEPHLYEHVNVKPSSEAKCLHCNFVGTVEEFMHAVMLSASPTEIGDALLRI